MEKVYAYTRVSTGKQVDGYGLEAQREAILAYAAANGLEVERWFIDEGQSGAKLERPALEELLAADGHARAVIVAKSDRLSRDMTQYYYLRFVLKRKGLDIISVAEDYSAAGAIGPVIEAMISSFAEFERGRIRDRTMAGRLLKAKSGGFVGGKVPFGYQLDRRGDLAIAKDDAKKVKLIFQMRDEGYGFSDIALAVGMPRSTVRTIAANPIYHGVYTYGDISVPRPDLRIVGE